METKKYRSRIKTWAIFFWRVYTSIADTLTTTETLQSKMKHRMSMFHLLKVLIINALCYENETWNQKKRLKVNIMYARVRSAFNWVQSVLTSRQRVLTWGWRVPASAFACQGSMPWQANTIHFLIAKLGIEPQLGNADARTRRPQVRMRPQRTYIYIYVYIRVK